MHEQADRFRAVLLAELDDLVQDLRDAEDLYRARYTRGDVSGYVLLENTAVLEHEIAGIAAVAAALRAADLPRGVPTGSLCGWFATLCRATIEEKRFPEGIAGLLARKCSKVLRYLNEP